MNWLRRLGLLVVLSCLVLVVGATSVFAASISEVADEAATTGFYLDSGVSISESDATEIVTAARNNGSRFYLIVLNDTPLGGNTSFAEAVYDELTIDAGTILVLSPEDVGWVTNDEGFTDADMEDAFENANSQGGTDAEYAANFVVSLFGITDSGQTPATTAAATSNASSDSSGGGGSGLLWFILIVGGIGLFVLFMMRRNRKPTVNAAAEQMAKARLAVQKQVDAVANDLLDMEDEVRVANNAEVDEYYSAASETYRTVTDRLQEAEQPTQVIVISNELDVAIWQLDCVEAVLDGKPKPPRPEPKRLEPMGSPSQDRVTIPAPRADYQRRPTRKSSYLGPGVMEILIGVAGQVLVGGSRRGSQRRSAAPSARAPRASSSRSKSGGGVVPGPGSPVSRKRTSAPKARRSSRSKRSGGGRRRGGGRRSK